MWHCRPHSGVQENNSSNDGTPDSGDLFVHAAGHCAQTFRITDDAGICNGNRFRFNVYGSEKECPLNAGVDKIIAALNPVIESYPTLSTADLIVRKDKWL
ncbi:hypothetical protein C6341_g23866 [Phytophthora cactorum]|nr:hypothetical protein PC120_g22789 [Phytophthora cactorum]KAG3130147.1 hypothetical protein C6341_g23866 [Phytophthora cactorum]